MSITEKPGIEELYTTARSTSDLTLSENTRGAADILIAAGWSQLRIGGALIRLHSDWDRAEKPPHGLPHAERMQRMGDLIERLTELPGIRSALTVKALSWGWEDAEAKVAAVLRYWLDDGCRPCGGTKWTIAAGTHRHTGKACPACAGTGKAQVPHGQEGRRLLNHMDGSVEVAHGHIRRALHRMRNKD